MIGMSLMWLVGMGGLLLVAVLCILVLVRSLLAPPGMGKMASCGACGHNLHAVESGRCPECGADLTKGGVTTPAMLVRLRGNTLEAVIAWTVLVTGVSSTIGTIVFTMAMSAWGGPMGNGPVDITQTLTPQPNFNAAQPTRAANYYIDMDIDVDVNADGRATSGTIQASMWTSGEEFILEMNPEDDSWTVTDDKNQELSSASSFDETAIEALYEAASLDLTDADIQTQMGDLRREFAQAERNPGNIGMTYGTTTSNNGGLMQTNMNYNSFGVAPATAFGDLNVEVILVFLVGFIIYIAGLVLIVIRRGRLMRRALEGAG